MSNQDIKRSVFYKELRKRIIDHPERDEELLSCIKQFRDNSRKDYLMWQSVLDHLEADKK